jgi:hypothetical protein
VTLDRPEPGNSDVRGLVMEPDGRFLAAWNRYELGADGLGIQPVVGLFDAAGAPLGPPLVLGTEIPGTHTVGQLVPAGPGRWLASFGGFLQRLTAGCGGGGEEGEGGGDAGGLCLHDGRFRVEVEWKLPGGVSGEGRALPLGGDSGAFWFFGPENLELLVKVLDGRKVNGRFWVFFGALSDVEYTVEVTDAATGATRSYVNPRGTMASRADTAAF